MKELSIREARERLAHLEELLDQEGEVTLTRRGKPIARFVPVVRRRVVPSHRRLRALMERLATPSEALLRDDRQRG